MQLKYCLTLIGTLTPIAASAETVTYTYDSKGHLIKAEHADGRNNGVKAEMTFDSVDNRLSWTITGRSKNPVVVVPLNGLTVIPLP